MPQFLSFLFLFFALQMPAWAQTEETPAPVQAQPAEVALAEAAEPPSAEVADSSTAEAAQTNVAEQPAALSSTSQPEAAVEGDAPEDADDDDDATAAEKIAPLAWSESGVASWYGGKFHGRKTASGERFNTKEFTAAHKTLPFGTRLRVKNLRTGQAVVVRVNDRGPFVKGRVIDLSQAAAQAIGMHGIAQVRLEKMSAEGSELAKQ